MAEIINLNRVRKARARDEARAEAEANRARDIAARHLDGHRREPDDD